MMIAMMPKKKRIEEPNGRDLRYKPVPIEKLLEWSQKLHKYAEAMQHSFTLAEQHGVEEVKVDGGMGFDKHIKRVRDVMADAEKEIRKDCIDAE